VQRNRYDELYETSYVDVGNGPVVVLAHGYLHDTQMWAPQIKSLSRHYRVVVPDMWGHGESGRLPRDVNCMRDLAVKYLGFFDHIGLERFAIAGAAMGGMWAAELALLAPERLLGIALLDTFLGTEDSRAKLQFAAMLNTICGAGYFPPAMVDGFLPIMFSKDTVTANPPFVERFRHMLKRATTRQLRESIVPIGRLIFDRRDTLQDLTDASIPSVVMTGELDRVRPPSDGKSMARAMRCRYVEFAGAAHVPTLETPEAVNDALCSFLREANS
jgi:pimeloyl-ACP methyl ester carboxylesterase